MGGGGEAPPSSPDVPSPFLRNAGGKKEQSCGNKDGNRYKYQGCHGTGKTGFRDFHFSRQTDKTQGICLKLLKTYFYTASLPLTQGNVSFINYVPRF